MTLDGDLLPRTQAVVHQGIADGWHRGAQIYVSRHGKTLASLALGERRPGEPMTADTLLLWLSAGKPRRIRQNPAHENSPFLPRSRPSRSGR